MYILAFIHMYILAYIHTGDPGIRFCIIRTAFRCHIEDTHTYTYRLEKRLTYLTLIIPAHCASLLPHTR